MLLVFVYFEVKEEIRRQLKDAEQAKRHLSEVVEECKKVTGLKEKLFLMNPETAGQGAVLLFDTRENWEAYRASPLFKATVLDICEGEPRTETYLHSASLTEGVLL
jgi:hypothetical protein